MKTAGTVFGTILQNSFILSDTRGNPSSTFLFGDDPAAAEPSVGSPSLSTAIGYFSDEVIVGSSTATAAYITGNVLYLGNVGLGSGIIRVLGNTSGSADLSVAAVAGSPNTINLPTTTGTAGQVLSTNGASPQQTSWVSRAMVPLTGTTGTVSGSPTAGVCDSG